MAIYFERVPYLYPTQQAYLLLTAAEEWPIIYSPHNDVAARSSVTRRYDSTKRHHPDNMRLFGAKLINEHLACEDPTALFGLRSGLLCAQIKILYAVLFSVCRSRISTPYLSFFYTAVSSSLFFQITPEG